jgi:hypothetical protein
MSRPRRSGSCNRQTPGWLAFSPVTGTAHALQAFANRCLVTQNLRCPLLRIIREHRRLNKFYAVVTQVSHGPVAQVARARP